MKPRPVSNKRANYLGMHWNPEETHHTIIDTYPLPAGIAGLTDGTTIWLNPDLTPQGRRSTLAHEIIHIERGIRPVLPGPLQRREESRVDREASHRLTPPTPLIEAIIWAGGDDNRAEIAAETNMDLDLTDTRLRTATPAEAAAIRKALRDLPQVP